MGSNTEGVSFKQAPWNWLCQATGVVPCKGRGRYTQ